MSHRVNLEGDLVASKGVSTQQNLRQAVGRMKSGIVRWVALLKRFKTIFHKYFSYFHYWSSYAWASTVDRWWGGGWTFFIFRKHFCIIKNWSLAIISQMTVWLTHITACVFQFIQLKIQKNIFLTYFFSKEKNYNEHFLFKKQKLPMA